jgi:hypothetical protein
VHIETAKTDRADALGACARLGTSSMPAEIAEAQRAAIGFLVAWCGAFMAGRHFSGPHPEGRMAVVESERTAWLLGRALALPPVDHSLSNAMGGALGHLRVALERGLRVHAWSPEAPESMPYVDVTERFARLLRASSVPPGDVEPAAFEEPGAWVAPVPAPSPPDVRAPRVPGPPVDALAVVKWTIVAALTVLVVLWFVLRS